jgi:hypothetical protein
MSTTVTSALHSTATFNPARCFGQRAIACRSAGIEKLCMAGDASFNLLVSQFWQGVSKAASSTASAIKYGWRPVDQVTRLVSFHGYTPLQVAISANRTEMVALLLKCGASLDLLTPPKYGSYEPGLPIWEHQGSGIVGRTWRLRLHQFSHLP